MFYVYILYSPEYDKYYIGQSPDLETRLLFHNRLSKSSYTSKYRPWTLVWSVPVQTRSVAIRIERYLKKKNRTFIKRLILDKDLSDYIIDRFDSSAG